MALSIDKLMSDSESESNRLLREAKSAAISTQKTAQAAAQAPDDGQTVEGAIGNLEKADRAATNADDQLTSILMGLFGAGAGGG